jgi:hypothetical protein
LDFDFFGTFCRNSGEGPMSKYSVPAGVPHAMGFEVTEKADILRVVFNATKTFN